MRRLDGVEIKVSLEGDNVAQALDRLNIDPGSDPEQRRVGFIEDVSAGSGLPLVDASIVLRVREDPDGDDKSTVKLRPCRASQLTDKWIDERNHGEPTLKIEEDWAGDRKVLAVSYDSKLQAGRINGAAIGGEDVSRLFNKDQERFLSDCGGLTVSLDALTLLPLIHTSKWKDVSVGRVNDVYAERWTIDDLDFLELSVRANDAGEARSLQDKFEHAVEVLGLERDAAQESKTRRVLEYLVDRVRGE